jgi:voltage-dependent potassium channel beta subunit
MNYRRMGKAGIKLSELSYGAWVTFGSPQAEEVQEQCMSAAYDAGINFFDNAEAYGGGQAEVVMGRIIKKRGWRRESLVVSTKLFWGGRGPNDVGLSHKRVLEGVNAALRRLQLEYVDLLFCHRPDPDTPIEETVRAMDIVIRQGKAFYWGTSEWSAADILRAEGIARQYGLTPPRMEQPEYNLLRREKVESEFQPLYSELGFGTTTWSPLASGVLTGKYNGGVPAGSRLADPQSAWLKDLVLSPERIMKVRSLEPIAKELGCTLAQLAIAWCLKNPHVSSVITGASRPEQVKENLKALHLVPKLTADVMTRIDAIFGKKSDDN